MDRTGENVRRVTASKGSRYLSQMEREAIEKILNKVIKNKKHGNTKENIKVD